MLDGYGSRLMMMVIAPVLFSSVSTVVGGYYDGNTFLPAVLTSLPLDNRLSLDDYSWRHPRHAKDAKPQFLSLLLGNAFKIALLVQPQWTRPLISTPQLVDVIQAIDIPGSAMSLNIMVPMSPCAWELDIDKGYERFTGSSREAACLS